MHEGDWVGLRQRGKNDDLLAVYKGPGKNGHFGARCLQKSLVTFLWLQYMSAGGKFAGIVQGPWDLSHRVGSGSTLAPGRPHRNPRPCNGKRQPACFILERRGGSVLRNEPTAGSDQHW